MKVEIWKDSCVSLPFDRTKEPFVFVIHDDKTNISGDQHTKLKLNAK